PFFILGPFVLIALAARSLLGPNPLPTWLLGLTVLGMAWYGYMLWPFRLPDHEKGFWLFLWFAMVLAVFLLPAVVVREGIKREWFRGLQRNRKRRKKRKRVEEDADVPRH